jgi:hypothetical protein
MFPDRIRDRPETAQPSPHRRRRPTEVCRDAPVAD